MWEKKEVESLGAKACFHGIIGSFFHCLLWKKNSENQDLVNLPSVTVEKIKYDMV